MAWPTSKTSGAASVPLLVLAASSSSLDEAFGGEGAGRDLTQVVHNVPFLNIIQTTVWGVGLGMRGIRAARESKKRNYAPNLS